MSPCWISIPLYDIGGVGVGSLNGAQPKPLAKIKNIIIIFAKVRTIIPSQTMNFLQKALLSIPPISWPVFFIFVSILTTFSPTRSICSLCSLSPEFIFVKLAPAPFKFSPIEFTINPCSSTCFTWSRAISLSAFFFSTPCSSPLISRSWLCAVITSSFFL